MKQIIVDCSQKNDKLNPIWRSFGYDEINWTYTPRGKQIYKEIGALSKNPYYIRCHHTFTSGNGLSVPTKGSGDVYHEDRYGKPSYNFSYLDQIFDTMLQNNCKPIVELGFMPDSLSKGPKPKTKYFYSDSDLFKYPPKDYQKWQQIVFQTVEHYVDKYGEDEVCQWYWEVWNEPDCVNFFKGSVKDYCKLYDFAVAGAERACPNIKIGGPALAGHPKFFRKFLHHCSEGKNYATGKKGSRLDFISFHAKGTSWPLKNQPFTMPSLETIFGYLENYHQVLKEFPNYQKLPILFDECDMAVATNYGVHDFPEFEFNNNEYYPIFIIRMVKYISDFIRERKMPIQFFTTWAFYFEGKRLFEGNRALFTNYNIKKPVFNAFSLLEKLGDTRIQFDNGESEVLEYKSFPKVDGFATVSKDQSVEVIIWNFDEQQQNGVETNIQLQINHLPFTNSHLSMETWQIDNKNSNAYFHWKELGLPQDPTEDQIRSIKKNEGLKLVKTENKLKIENSIFKKELKLSSQSVILLKLYAEN